MQRASVAEKAVYKRAHKEFIAEVERAVQEGRAVMEEWPNREALRRYKRPIALFQQARTEAGLAGNCGRARDLMRRAFAAIRAAKR